MSVTVEWAVKASSDIAMWSFREKVCFSSLRPAMTCGVGSWRHSGQWWSVTPWWCWSPSTCTSSEVCPGSSDRSWACRRKGEFLCVCTYWHNLFFLVSKRRENEARKFMQTCCWLSYHYTCLTSGFVTWVWNGMTQWSCLHVSCFLLRSYWLASSSCTTSTQTSWLSLTSTTYPSDRLPGENMCRQGKISHWKKIVPASYEPVQLMNRSAIFSWMLKQALITICNSILLKTILFLYSFCICVVDFILYCFLSSICSLSTSPFYSCCITTKFPLGSIKFVLSYLTGVSVCTFHIYDLIDCWTYCISYIYLICLICPSLHPERKNSGVRSAWYLRRKSCIYSPIHVRCFV